MAPNRPPTDSALIAISPLPAPRALDTRGAGALEEPARKTAELGRTAVVDYYPYRNTPPHWQRNSSVSKAPARASQSKSHIYIGIGGWTFPPWRGVFYPDKLPQSKELEYAASKLTSIEINGTY